VATTASDLIDGAQRVEELGFHSIWMADAIGRGYFTADPLIALGVIAGATRRLELGTCILQVPLAQPVALARSILTVALAAPDRLVIGVGAGSTARDFAAVGADFGGRFETLDTSLAMMRALWRGERVGEAELTPTPDLRGGAPVLIGAWRGRWIERAATEFDGWIGSGGKAGSTRPDGTFPLAAWERVEAAVRRFRGSGGRRAVLASVVADLDADAPAEPDDPIDLRCPPEEARRRLHRLADMGFDDVILVSANQSADHLDALAALMRR
jgi:alkanesulfonate monooxygenase SsuD/methylene tetrahydromethanopterin reductase-like flavin-dependent oxidoreductase (luciferase family)